MNLQEIVFYGCAYHAHGWLHKLQLQILADRVLNPAADPQNWSVIEFPRIWLWANYATLGLDTESERYGNSNARVPHIFRYHIPVRSLTHPNNCKSVCLLCRLFGGGLGPRLVCLLPGATSSLILGSECWDWPISRMHLERVRLPVQMFRLSWWVLLMQFCPHLPAHTHSHAHTWAHMKINTCTRIVTCSITCIYGCPSPPTPPHTHAYSPSMHVPTNIYVHTHAHTVTSLHPTTALSSPPSPVQECRVRRETRYLWPQPH